MYLEFAIIAGLLCLGLADIDPLVQLPYGTIRGRTATTFIGNPYYAFQGIPFAAPPLGKLRFKPPVPPESWTGILNTTEYDTICFQVTLNTDEESEDCLYLNVYTPQLSNQLNDTNLLPVLVFIYGGGFIEGNCFDYLIGPDFMIDNDVILVSVNYRVGPFGFLSTQDVIIPGNNGLWDQHMAIKWTHDNIHLFGGDSSRITISGQSAGSASVSYQFLNNNSKGLFRAAIMQSGSFLSPWSIQRKAREIAFKTASYLDDSFATSNDSEALLEFLQSVAAEDLDEASYTYSQLDNPEVHQISQGFFWAPVIEPEHENAFLTKKMYVSLKNGDFLQVPILIGITSEESLFEANHIDLLQYNAEQYNIHPEWLVPQDMQIQDPDQQKRIGLLIKTLYTHGDDMQNDPAYTVKYYSDTSFTRSVIRHAELQARFTDVYFYQLSYDGAIGNIDIIIDGADNVEHSEELKYIYRAYWPGYDSADLSKFPEKDGVTHNRLVKIWTDFVKYMNPTPEPSDLLQNITWPKVTGEQPELFPYVDIDVDLTIRQNPKEKTYTGWKALYNTLQYDDFDTY